MGVATPRMRYVSRSHGGRFEFTVAVEHVLVVRDRAAPTCLLLCVLGVVRRLDINHDCYVREDLGRKSVAGVSVVCGHRKRLGTGRKGGVGVQVRMGANLGWAAGVRVSNGPAGST